MANQGSFYRLRDINTPISASEYTGMSADEMRAGHKATPFPSQEDQADSRMAEHDEAKADKANLDAQNVGTDEDAAVARMQARSRRYQQGN